MEESVRNERKKAKIRSKNMPFIQWLGMILLIVLALLTIIPFLWMVSASFKANNEVLTMIQLFTSSFAVYGFSELNFKGRDILFLAYIGTIAVPWQSYMIPQFIMMRKVGLTDTLWSLVLLQAFNAFGVFLLKQYYSSIPDSLCESARIDGLSEWEIYRKIILPLTKPAIASLTIITFVNTWNDYMGPFIYLSSTENKTIQLGLKMFIGLFDAEYALIMAASVVSVLPVAFIFLAMQKYFVEGIASSGMKE